MPKGPFPPLPENPILDIPLSEVILASDSEEDSPSAKRARNNRILRHAENYLRGETLYIHSAKLRGPVVKNPWRKGGAKCTAQRQHMVDKLKAGAVGRRKPAPDSRDGKEILATPTPKHGWGRCKRDVISESPTSGVPLVGGWTAINIPRLPSPPAMRPEGGGVQLGDVDTVSVFSNDDVPPVVTPGKRKEKHRQDLPPPLMFSPSSFYKRIASKPLQKPPPQGLRSKSWSGPGDSRRGVAGNKRTPPAVIPRSRSKPEIGAKHYGETSNAAPQASKQTAVPEPRKRRVRIDFTTMSPFVKQSVAVAERSSPKRKRKKIEVSNAVNEGFEGGGAHLRSASEQQAGGASEKVVGGSQDLACEGYVDPVDHMYKGSRDRRCDIGGNVGMSSGTKGKHGDSVALESLPLIKMTKSPGPTTPIGQQLIRRDSAQPAHPLMEIPPPPAMVPVQPENFTDKALSERPLAEDSSPPTRPPNRENPIVEPLEPATGKYANKLVVEKGPEIFQSTQTQLIAAKKGFYDAIIESPFAFQSNLGSTAEGTLDVLRPDAYFDDAGKTLGINTSSSGSWGNRGRDYSPYKTPAPRARNWKPLDDSQEPLTISPPVTIAGAFETPKPPDTPAAMTFTPFSAFATPTGTPESKRGGISPLTFSPLRDVTQATGRHGSSTRKSVKFAGFGLLDDDEDGGGGDDDDDETMSFTTGSADSPRNGQQVEDKKEDLVKEVMGFMGSEVWDIDEELKKMAAANTMDKGNLQPRKSVLKRQWR